MAHSDCGRTCGRAGKTANPLRTRAILERFCGGDSLRRGAISSVRTFTFTFSRSHSDLFFYPGLSARSSPHPGRLIQSYRRSSIGRSAVES